MEHPNAEELVDFVYGELSPSRQTEIELHVDRCAQCRETLDEWGQTRAALRTWKVPGRTPVRSRRIAPVLRWAVAAMVLLGVGYGIGRINAWRSPDVAGLQAQVARQVRDQLQTELARLAADQETRHQQDYQRAFAQATAQLDARRQADYASLRRDMETVAVRTEERFDSMGLNAVPGNVLPVSQSIQPNNR